MTTSIPADSPNFMTSVSHYLNRIEEIRREEELNGNYSDFIFRGQRRDQSLRPKLVRLIPHGNRGHIESLMFDEFKRNCLALIDHKPDSDWDVLSIAQHHGMPTRLLDWTYSALAALWFAVEKPPFWGRRAVDSTVTTEDSVVWLLKTRPEDFTSEAQTPDPFSVNIGTMIYRPKVLTRRISAQSGLFTTHQIFGSEDAACLEENIQYNPRLVKLVINSDHFKEIKRHLNGCGVNQFTLFPDLQGLCGHIQWRYTKHDDEASHDNLISNVADILMEGQTRLIGDE